MLAQMPDRLEISDCTLVSLSQIEDLQGYIKKLNRARNFFRHNFGDSKISSLDNTQFYVEKVIENSQSQKLYGIYLDSILIGQYGLRACDMNYILLDNAIRFESKGPRDIFHQTSVLLIQMLLDINPGTKILIAIKAGNIHAKRLHGYGKYSPVSLDISRKLGFDDELKCFEFNEFN